MANPTLKPGQKFRLLGGNPKIWEVAHVNESRAHCIHAEKQTVVVRDQEGKVARTFEATNKTVLDISPSSEVELLP